MELPLEISSVMMVTKWDDDRGKEHFYYEDFI